MTKAQWIQAANKLLKDNPNMSYQQAQQQLADQGFNRPTGITTKGNRRFGPKATRTPGQNLRRAQQEKTSTEAASQHQKTLADQRREQTGIADFAGLPRPHREHPHNQDVATGLTEGAPGDYVLNIPEDMATAKTSLETTIRNKYGGRYAVGIGVNGLRVVPKKFWDERVNPDDLPGIDVDERHSLEDQISVLKSISRQPVDTNIGGFAQQTPLPQNTAGRTQYKPDPLGGVRLDVPTPQVTPPQQKEDLSQPQLTFDTTPKPVNPVTFGLTLAAGVGLTFIESVKSAVGLELR